MYDSLINFVRLLTKLPNWIGGILLFVAFLLVLYSVTLAECRKNLFGLSFGPDKPCTDRHNSPDNQETETWYGYYIDVCRQSKEEYEAREKLKLTFERSGNITKVSGQSSGEVCDEKLPKIRSSHWLETGYVADSHMALAYVETKKHKGALGSGEYHLQEAAHNKYAGVIIMNQQGDSHHWMCPYIMSTSRIDNRNAAVNILPMFKKEKACKEVEVRYKVSP